MAVDAGNPATLSNSGANSAQVRSGHSSTSVCAEGSRISRSRKLVRALDFALDASLEPSGTAAVIFPTRGSQATRAGSGSPGVPENIPQPIEPAEPTLADFVLGLDLAQTSDATFGNDDDTGDLGNDPPPEPVLVRGNPLARNQEGGDVVFSLFDDGFVLSSTDNNSSSGPHPLINESTGIIIDRQIQVIVPIFVC